MVVTIRFFGSKNNIKTITTMERFLLSTLLVLCFSSYVNASCLSPSSNKESDFNDCLKEANAGDAKAQYQLAEMYGTSGDRNTAFTWYTKSAENGYIKAQNILGFLYYWGLSVDRDVEKAFEWYKKAAEQGDKEAIETLNKIMIKNWDIKVRMAATRQYHYTDSLNRTTFFSHISYSNEKKKNIYFEIDNPKVNTCHQDDYKGKYDSTSIWEFNGKAVSMLMLCIKREDYYSIRATPETVKGYDFVVNEFKNSAKTVSVNGSGYNFHLSSKNFSKVWDSVSDEVL
jgi:hypothetical protein